MGHSTPTIAPEIEILLYDEESDLTRTKMVCLSRLDQNVFCLVSNGVAVVQERIINFAVFEAALRQALLQLKTASQSHRQIGQIQFVIDGLDFPVDATIEPFCSSENLYDFTMTFSSRGTKPSSWICMGPASLENLISSFNSDQL